MTRAITSASRDKLATSKVLPKDLDPAALISLYD